MTYSVVITDTQTGETRTRHIVDQPWNDATAFWWTDGNFGCDCNRSAEFIRASGREPTEQEYDAQKCDDGVTFRFYVSHAILENGTRVELDSEWRVKH